MKCKHEQDPRICINCISEEDEGVAKTFKVLNEVKLRRPNIKLNAQGKKILKRRT